MAVIAKYEKVSAITATCQDDRYDDITFTPDGPSGDPWSSTYVRVKNGENGEKVAVVILSRDDVRELASLLTDAVK